MPTIDVYNSMGELGYGLLVVAMSERVPQRRGVMGLFGRSATSMQLEMMTLGVPE